MSQPPPPSSGRAILPWAQSLWRAVLQQRPIAGPGLACRPASNGTVISLAEPARRPPLHPFQIVLRSALLEDEPTPCAYVNRGAFSYQGMTMDEEGEISIRVQERDIRWGGDAGPPLGLDEAAGKFFFTEAEASYGFWVVALSLGYSLEPQPGGFPRGIGLMEPWLHVSDVAISAATPPTIPPSNPEHPDPAYAAWFLGRVDTDALARPSLHHQYRKCDISAAGAFWISPRLRSLDDPNDLGIGSDGGLVYVTPE